MRSFLLISAVAFSISGCVNMKGKKHDYGNARINDAALVAQIEKGKSTKADLKMLLGDPAAVDFSDTGLEKWVYTYFTSEIIGSAFNPKVDSKSKSLTVQFDKEGVVMNVGSGQTEGGMTETRKEPAASAQ